MKTIILAALTVLVSTQSFAFEITDKQCKRYVSLKREQGKKVEGRSETTAQDLEKLADQKDKSALTID